MKLSNYEKETIIVYNEAEDFARIDTCNKSLRRKLAEFAQKSPSVVQEREDEISSTYKLPKKWVKVHMPRVLSEKKRQELKQRALENLHPKKVR